MSKLLPSSSREIDIQVAEKLGKKVVDREWHCYIDPEAGNICALSYKDPNFKEGDTGIRYLTYPVYLNNYREVVTFEDGTLGYEWDHKGVHNKQVVWPPQVDPEDEYCNPQGECHYLTPVENYSEDISAAMGLLVVMKAYGWYVLISNHIEHVGWQVKASKPGALVGLSAAGQTLAQAIALIFLKVELHE